MYYAIVSVLIRDGAERFDTHIGVKALHRWRKRLATAKASQQPPDSGRHEERILPSSIWRECGSANTSISVQ